MEDWTWCLQSVLRGHRGGAWYGGSQWYGQPRKRSNLLQARRCRWPCTASVRFRARQRSLRFAKANGSGKSSARAPVLRVSAPLPWLVSRSRRSRRARLSPDFAFSAWQTACRSCRILSLRSSRGSGPTQRRQRSPPCLSRSVQPRSDRPPAKETFFEINLARSSAPDSKALREAGLLEKSWWQPDRPPPTHLLPRVPCSATKLNVRF